MFLSLKVFQLVYKSNRKSKYAHNTVHGLVFPSHCTTAIWSIIPEARTCGVKTSTVLLHDNTGHNVLERLAKLGQLVQTLLDDIGSPLVDLVVLVCISADGALDRLFDNVAHLIHDEGCFFCWLIFVHLEDFYQTDAGKMAKQNSTAQIGFQYGGLVWWPKGLSNHEICSSQYPLLLRGERLFVFDRTESAVNTRPNSATFLKDGRQRGETLQLY